MIRCQVPDNFGFGHVPSHILRYLLFLAKPKVISGRWPALSKLLLEIRLQSKRSLPDPGLESTGSSEPAGRGRHSRGRRRSCPRPPAGACPDAGCSRPLSRRGRPSSWLGSSSRPKIPFASPSSFSPRRVGREVGARSLANRSALLVSRPRSPFATVSKVAGRSPLPKFRAPPRGLGRDCLEKTVERYQKSISLKSRADAEGRENSPAVKWKTWSWRGPIQSK